MRSSAFKCRKLGSVIGRRFLVITFLLAAVIVPLSYAPTARPSPPPPGAKTPHITLIDIIPKSLSGETQRDSEPNIAVNPLHPLQIAASAFTREPMRRLDRAPVFVSTDGGNHWSLRSVIPSPQITCDITLRFAGKSDVLYISALRNEQVGYANQELIICQSPQYATTRLIDTIFSHRNYIDQPYIAATTAASGDHVFVADCDFNYPSNPGSLGRGQAVIDQSLDAPSANFTAVPVELKPAAIDWEARSATSDDGKVVYAVFNRVIAIDTQQCNQRPAPLTMTSEVVVVRDDNGGASTPPFSSLPGPNHTSGVVAVPSRKLAGSECLGGDRIADDLALAVDPRDARKVYLAWSSWDDEFGRVSLHLRYSSDGGKKWSAAVRTVVDAKNPGLAVNAKGTVGFVYQQFMKNEGYVWKTLFEESTDDYKTTPQVWTLAQFPLLPQAGYEACCFEILLGDYLHLMAVNNDFYGIFSSNNCPDRSHFPNDVTFQRNESKDHKNLLDLHGNVVPPSIDPFFFKVTEK